MSKDTKDKDKSEPDKENESKGPTCIYCGQEIDPKVLERQEVKTKMPIPKRQWALVVAEQSKINDCDVEAERVKLRIMKKTNEFAKAHRIAFMIGLGIEVEPPKEKEDVDHQWEFFQMDTVIGKKYYLDRKLDEPEQKELYDLWWEYSAKIEESQEASMSYFETLTAVAKDCGWGFRPLRVEQGHFIAQSIVDEAVKRAEERVKKEIEDKKAKPREASE